jgi:hypothetical protein
MVEMGEGFWSRVRDFTHHYRGRGKVVRASTHPTAGYKCRAGKGQRSGSFWHGNKAHSAAVPRPASGTYAAPLGPRFPFASPREGALCRSCQELAAGGTTIKLGRISAERPPEGVRDTGVGLGRGFWSRVRDFTHHCGQGVGGRGGACKHAPYGTIL